MSDVIILTGEEVKNARVLTQMIKECNSEIHDGKSDNGLITTAIESLIFKIVNGKNVDIGEELNKIHGYAQQVEHHISSVFYKQKVILDKLEQIEKYK